MIVLVAGQEYDAATFTRLGSSKITYRTQSTDGRKLDFTLVGVDSPGQYSFFNQAITSGPGIAGGYYAGGESYNIDSGTIIVSATTGSRFAGTFSGTARGLLGASDLVVANGSFDIEF